MTLIRTLSLPAHGVGTAEELREMLRELALTPSPSPTPLRVRRRAEGRGEKGRWQWDGRTKQYRDTKTGQFVGQVTMRGLRNEFIEQEKGVAEGLARRLFAEEISIEQWRAGMREHIKRVFSIEYMLARGGRRAMTKRDWGVVGNMVRRQYGFLENFTADLVNGRYTANQAGVVANRAKLYTEAASQAFERAQTEGRGMPRLRQYPGDGQTRCRTNCGCWLEIKEFEDRWEVRWFVNEEKEHCEDCLRLAREWSPLAVGK